MHTFNITYPSDQKDSHWFIFNPGQQKIGSFHPHEADDWEEGAYAQQGIVNESTVATRPQLDDPGGRRHLKIEHGFLMHCTLPFTGDRYAAVFFCIGRVNDRLPALSRAYIEHLGFGMPPEAAGAPLLTEVGLG